MFPIEFPPPFQHTGMPDTESRWESGRRRTANSWLQQKYKSGVGGTYMYINVYYLSVRWWSREEVKVSPIPPRPYSSADISITKLVHRLQFIRICSSSVEVVLQFRMESDYPLGMGYCKCPRWQPNPSANKLFSIIIFFRQSSGSVVVGKLLFFFYPFRNWWIIRIRRVLIIANLLLLLKWGHSSLAGRIYQLQLVYLCFNSILCKSSSRAQ